MTARNKGQYACPHTYGPALRCILCGSAIGTSDSSSWEAEIDRRLAERPPTLREFAEAQA